jgi:hypothetical protein
LRKLTVTFMCENRHEVESVTVDLSRRPEIIEEDIWELQTRGSYCRKCGSKVFVYHVRYK